MGTETYKQKWIRLQVENPGVFNCFFIIPGRILAVFIVIIGTKKLEGSLPSYKFSGCLLDFSHIKTQKWNDSLHKNEGMTKLLQAIYTLGVDLSI